MNAKLNQNKRLKDQLLKCLEPIEISTFDAKTFTVTGFLALIESLLKDHPFLKVLAQDPSARAAIYIEDLRDNNQTDIVFTKISFATSYSVMKKMHISNVISSFHSKETEVEPTVTIALNDAALSTNIFEKQFVDFIVKALFYNGRSNSDYDTSYANYLETNSKLVSELLDDR